jgi:hypothetical protein
VKQTSEYQEIAEEVEKLMKEIQAQTNKSLKEEKIEEVEIIPNHSKKRRTSSNETVSSDSSSSNLVFQKVQLSK